MLNINVIFYIISCARLPSITLWGAWNKAPNKLLTNLPFCNNSSAVSFWFNRNPIASAPYFHSFCQTVAPFQFYGNWSRVVCLPLSTGEWNLSRLNIWPNNVGLDSEAKYLVKKCLDRSGRQIFGLTSLCLGRIIRKKWSELWERQLSAKFHFVQPLLFCPGLYVPMYWRPILPLFCTFVQRANLANRLTMNKHQIYAMNLFLRFVDADLMLRIMMLLMLMPGCQMQVKLKNPLVGLYHDYAIMVNIIIMILVVTTMKSKCLMIKREDSFARLRPLWIAATAVYCELPRNSSNKNPAFKKGDGDENDVKR